MREETRLIRSLVTEAGAGRPLHPSPVFGGPVFAAPFHLTGDGAQAGEGAQVAYSYARSHNPTWTALERTLGVIESGGEFATEVRVFGSGMTAVAAVFGAVLRPGDVVVLAENAYFAARSLLREQWEPMGVKLRTAPVADFNDARRLDALVRGARLVWLETPSNPTLAVTDLRLASARAHAAGALVAVDNTTATPLGQRVLALGADLSVVSDTKLMCGHSDLLLGHVATRDAGLLEKLDRWRTLYGGGPGPMEAWLGHRSLATLPLRFERSCGNALAIAEFLARRPEVLEVFYPGLAGHPGHAIAAGQMQAFGPVVSFTLPDRGAAERFLARCELVTEATSFGGISTTAERRARWGHDAVAEGFVRLSAGCEAAEDLMADMGRALERVG